MRGELDFSGIDALVASFLSKGRIPGGAVAIVSGGKTVFVRGYGYRDLETKLPMNADTIYPIASTTKAMNATLVGMLVDEAKLAWDAPVQAYLPDFRFGDSYVSAHVTIRDLLAMRTGLPRHDWIWAETKATRAELVERLRYLEFSCGFREKFQYNNMTATTAGHLAEVVTGRTWENLVRERILQPLGMTTTTFASPGTQMVTRSYHENRSRELVSTQPLSSEVTAPSGGAIHSTVEEMARWIAFNLEGGKVSGRSLIQPETLREIQSPQVPARSDPSCPTPDAAYGMGWFVDVYNGRRRLSHGGYLHDVNSSVMLFPGNDLGIVCFINFGSVRLARVMNEHFSDLLLGSKPVQSLEEKLASYEQKLTDNQERIRAAQRIRGTSPSHALEDYAGTYVHPAYGGVEVACQERALTFRRGNLHLGLEHWHYDVWIFADNDLFEIHEEHCFDATSRVPFETGADGAIKSLSIALEPATAPIRFVRISSGRALSIST